MVGILWSKQAWRSRQDARYDIDDFLKEMTLPIVIGIMTVVGVVTSMRAVAQMVGRCACCRRRCHDKAVPTDDLAKAITFPEKVYVTKAGERYHADSGCSGFKLHKVTPCAICISKAGAQP